MIEEVEVAVIGAGPSGAIAAALLKRAGHSVVVLEQSHFPRFSIGESLLPQCMEFVSQAGMIEAVNAEGFQRKNGAAFACDGRYGSFDFRKKFSVGPGTTYQVQRATFDKVLADEAGRQGADIRYGHKVLAIDTSAKDASILSVEGVGGKEYDLKAGFVLDASGFGRVLPRLLDMEAPSDFPVRRSVFTHVEDRITDKQHDRDKILIVIHPKYPDVWYWLIPFSNGRCSVGVVARENYFDELAEPGLDAENVELLHAAIAASPDLSKLLADAVFDMPVQNIVGYSSNVKSLHGQRFALLGNAGEFLDPVFSSGVTIAMKSACLAAPLVSRQLKGEIVDWQSEYAEPLKQGVDVFRTYVNAWYEGSFQKVIFAENQNPAIREMVCSILAGFAWDEKNPFVKEPSRRLKALSDLCASV